MDKRDKRIFQAERATVAAASAVLSQGARPRTIRRLQGAQRDHLRQALWAAMAGCAGGLRSLQDPVQPVYPLVPDGCLRQDLTGTGAARGQGDTLMIDSTFMKAHRTAASLRKRGSPAGDRRHERPPEPKLHMLSDGKVGRWTSSSLQARWPTVGVRLCCCAICRQPGTSGVIRLMMPTGCVKSSRIVASVPASRPERNAGSQRDTTSGFIANATALTMPSVA